MTLVDEPRPSLLSRLLTWGLRLFFHLLYNQFAWSYDLVASLVSLGRWKTWVMAAIPFVQGTSILEIGHGPGHLQHQLWERGEKPIGLDASAFMGKIAKRNLRAIPKGGWLVRGKAQDMPFPGEFFSCIVATFPSEYILDPKTLGEIYRTLIKGGRFVVIPAAWITGRKWLDRFVAWVFRITLQSPLMEEFRNMYLERVNKAGFEVSLRDVELISSQLLIILADKSIE